MNTSFSNEKLLSQIATEIFAFAVPKIEESRHQSICDFIKITINGDEIKAYLAVTAALTKDRKGILVYVLTNRRLIKIEIDDKEIISAFYFLTAMTGLERKLVDSDAASVQVSFQNGSMGLRYDASKQAITEFFQKVEQARPEGTNPNG